MATTLYHFTAKHLWLRIKHEGITKGGHLDRKGDKLMMHTGTIWLTRNPSPVGQQWHSQITIPYSRTAVRLTVRIPTINCVRLFSWRDFVQLREIDSEIAEDLASVGGSEDWMIYAGKIPSAWLVSTVIYPAEAMEVAA